MSQLTDTTQPIEPFLKQVAQSLDTQFNPNAHTTPEQYQSQFIPQLKATSAIIINGNPIQGKQNFQKLWFGIPQTQHSLTNYDVHLIPGSNTFNIVADFKLRFDESGQNKFGESSDLVANTTSMQSRRYVWGSWYGLSVNLIVDDIVYNNPDVESINSMNWRITYKPKESIIDI